MVSCGGESFIWGGFVGGETDDVGVEALGFAVVPHARVATVGVEEPAEAVERGAACLAVGVGGPRRVLAVGENKGSQGGLHFFFAEKFVGAQGFIPFC